MIPRLDAVKPRVLLLDIETKPNIVHAWGLWDQNIGLNQVVEFGSVICVGAKWLGEKAMHFHADWIDGHKGMLEAIHALISEADGVITYNGDKFDLPKLRGEFCVAGLPPPAPVASIDVLKAVKKMGLASNKLAHVGPLFTGGKKLAHEGHELWVKVMAGDPKAQAKMERYCCQDVKLLEQVYTRIKGYIPNHPHMGLTPSLSCSTCGSSRTQSRGFRRTKSFLIARHQCQACGAWQSGKRVSMAA